MMGIGGTEEWRKGVREGGTEGRMDAGREAGKEEGWKWIINKG